MSNTFTVNDISYAEEDMTEEQKKLYSTILNIQSEIESLKLTFNSYDTYSKVLSQQLAQSLTSDDDEEADEESDDEETSADEPSET
tara:strand:+ start:1375 stop:1632 length:258 start_codon:yes stop_codon:yes gene_type:complete